MKNIKVEKLPSGSYRIRKQVNGKRVPVIFDHKPKQAEILRALSDIADTTPVKGSFQICAEKYIASKNNVLSPKTVREYSSLIDSVISDSFKNKKIGQITQQDIQREINRYAADHAPKTVRNLHGFISAVLKQFRPNMNIHTTLPQKREYEHYTPSEQDIKRILDASKNDKRYCAAFRLGIMGLRRSEICALTLDDIDGNTLTIDKALVKNKDNKFVIKQTKTVAGTRKIYIPDELIKEIRANGYIYNGYPNKLLDALKRYQDKLGIPHFRFHDLRHFFASYAHSQGVSDADIMASGGWKSMYTMQNIYRHEMKAKEEQKRIFDALLSDEEE